MIDLDKVLSAVQAKYEGIVYTITCNTQLLIDYQKLTGKNPLDGEISKKMGLEDYTIMAAIGMFGVDKALEKAKELACKSNFADIAAFVGQLFQNATVKEKKTDE